MQQKLHAARIHTLGELRKRRGTLESWGPYAKELYKRVNGESDGEIETNRERKSIGISRTFDSLFEIAELRRRVHILSRHFCYAIFKLDVIPTLFHFSIHYEMNQKSHINISKAEIFTEKKFDALCIELFNQADIHRRLQVIRLSISCSSFTKHSRKELSLIHFNEEQKMHTLSKTTQMLRQKYGLDVVKFGSEF